MALLSTSFRRIQKVFFDRFENLLPFYPSDDTQIVAIHRLVGEGVVLTDQLVGSVVLVGDRGAPSSDRGYVPVVVVRIGVGRVAAVLVRGQ